MSRWLLRVLSCAVFCLLPTVTRAQSARLKVLAPATSLEVTPARSTTYLEVTQTQNGVGVCTYRCEPNAITCASSGCAGTQYNGLTSRLVYDVTREKLVSCNGETVTVDGAECSLSDGILSATTHVRLGSLKIIPKAVPEHAGLSLDTGGAGVRLQFKESSEDFWNMGYYNGLGTKPMFTPSPAGTFKVVASDLRAHCLPTQADSALEVTIPEGGQVELTLLFRGTQCELTVQRTLSSGAPGGTVQTEPPGLVCGAEPTSPCTGRFAFGTELMLTPQPTSSGGYSFKVGDGCVPGNQPCKHSIRSDRSFSVNFNLGGSSSADAGVPSADSGAAQEDSGVEPSDSGGPMTMADAGAPDIGAPAGEGGTPVGDAASSSGGEQGAEDDTDSGGDSGCSLHVGSGGSSAAGRWLAPLLLAVLLVRRRRSR